ncbi:MAG: glycosyltransferase family 2 protein [Thermincola sp.]|jgi:glycosyltransferase involved in cell wall biosynthesis|nr:glycosyltransferase family 2 protein [Thermincola sp.]MDT3703442.1 glycosyltransferase family 2 protein [Thermincola sp.]
MPSEEIKVSIITASFNSASFIEKALASVFNQSYRNIDAIVMDGGSTDGTVDIIRNHSDRINYWTSEPDRGISHAWNKGLSYCTGDIIGILNADDFYEPDAVGAVVRIFTEHPEAGFVFGDLQMCDINGVPRYRQEGDPLYRSTIAFNMPSIPHPTVFVRRSIYEEFGGFDESYKTAMDYEFLLRLTRQGVRGHYLPIILTNMCLGGESDINYTRAYREVMRASVKYGYSRPMALARYSYRCFRSIVRRSLERLGLDFPVRIFRACTGSRYKY